MLVVELPYVSNFKPLCRYILYIYIVPSDYGRDVAGTVTFIPGGPTEVTTQLRILNDDRLEFDETFPIILQLTPAAITAGGQLGLRREAEVTIINDDSKISMCFLSCINIILQLNKCCSYKIW